MKFSRLRLSGFKSFVDPSELIITDGLTGVVGPNGCGKSNLLEALRWVMGETSPKSMRGSGMEDVIFAGTHGRAARNFAEVTLLIDNEDRDAPEGFNEDDILEVSRRIQRDAGSSYRVNGRETRARDVQTLFADTGTGAHSPSLVRQGQIGQLVNAKPKARRAILEEAAGIGGLYSRRHEAELRLRAAEQNLERLDDVTGNLDLQLSGLKRQARQATRYKNLSQHIRKAESILFHLRHEETARAVSRAEEALRKADSGVAKTTLEARQAAKAEETASDSLTPLREKATIAAAVLQRLKIEQENLETRETEAQINRDRLTGRLEQSRADVNREEDLIRDALSTLDQIRDEYAELEREPVDVEAEQLAVKDVEIATLQLTELEDEADNLVRELASLAAERQTLERDVRSAGQRVAELEEELASAQSALGALGASASATELAKAGTRVTDAQTALKAAEKHASEADRTRSGLEDRENNLRGPLQDAEQTFARLTAEAGALENMLIAPDSNNSPPVMDGVKVQPGYERALGAALGDDLEAPADDLALFHWRRLPPLGAPPALPGKAEPLSAFVKGPEELNRRLSQIGVITLADGPRLQSRLEAGQRLVSVEGDFWRWDGFTAHAEALGGAATLLAKKNRLFDLEAELKQAEPLVRDLRENSGQTRDALRVAVETDKAARLTVTEAQSALTRAERSRADIHATVSAETARQEALTDSTEKLARTIAEAGRDHDTAVKALDVLRPTDALEAQSSSLRTRVDAARATLAEARSAQEGYVRERAARSSRLEKLEHDEKAWQSRTKTAGQHLETLRQRIAETEEELAKACETRDTEVRRNALLDQVAAAETTAADASNRLAEAETITRDLRETARSAEALAGEAREARARNDALLEGARERLAEAAARTREVLECAPEDVLERAGVKPGETLPPLPEIEARAEKLKRERDNVGAVNLRAEEEMQELQAQRDALEVESEDLSGAIHRLRQGIQSLNREGRERMLAAFNEVNEHFQVLFTHLFDGGEAALELVESDDPLDAGLEVMAQPPGKKTRALSLLSGGEQALTAMALIFAVFLTNPAPICVLDEVDAPLDDANVERFCAMLEEMTRRTDTRFLIITHHSLTMSRMDCLYGVTMAEKGVSQLVSVDLASAERIQAA